MTAGLPKHAVSAFGIASPKVFLVYEGVIIRQMQKASVNIYSVLDKFSN